MKNKKMIALMWVLALAPFVLVALSWNKLPDLVPLHWNTANQVDRYADKSQLWLLCCIAPALCLLFQLLPKIDPKKENYERFQGKYDLFGPILPGILLIALLFTVSEAIEPGALPIGKLLLGAVSIVLMVAGNIMGKVKTNWFMGIRTPWALSDPDVWGKTHRMGGASSFFAQRVRETSSYSTFAAGRLSFMSAAWLSLARVPKTSPYFSKRAE